MTERIRFSPLLAKLLVATYTPYYQAGLRVGTRGKGRTHTYEKNNTDDMSRLQDKVREWDPDVAFAEDAGSATELSDDEEGDADYFSAFKAHVYDSIDDTLHQSIIPESGGGVFNGVIVLASTAPFENLNTGENCRHYAEGCNWAGHNQTIEEYVADYNARTLPALRRVFLADVANDTCSAHRALAQLNPPLVLTEDGVHLGPLGQILYALSLFKALGGTPTLETVRAVVGSTCSAADPAPTAEQVGMLYDFAFPTTPTPPGPCLIDPTCAENYSSDAADCMEYCDPVIHPEHDCKPYFSCSFISSGSAPCDDEEFCNGEDSCSNSVCVVHAGDPCSSGDSCNAVCNETFQTCVAPITTPCDDGNLCTESDYCNGLGSCEGTPKNCSQFDAACTISACETATGECADLPRVDGTPCDDHFFCNGEDSCAGGACGGHGGDPCAGGDSCNAVCNETFQTCVAPITTPCDDADPCTESDHCNGLGACEGTSKNCSQADTACATAVCEPSTGACVPQEPKTDGTPCNDQMFCNGEDFCSGGVCDGHAGDPCTGGDSCNSFCNEAPDTCTAPAATSCDDHLQCNGPDRCSDGVCVHGPEPCVAPGDCVNVNCTEQGDVRSCGTLFADLQAPCTCDANDPCIESCIGTCNGEGACGSPGFCPVCTGPRTKCKHLGRGSLRLSSQSATDSTPADSLVDFHTSKGDATALEEFGGIDASGGVDTDALTVCIYADNGEVLWYGALPENECAEGTQSCWDRKGGGNRNGRLKYKNRSSTFPSARGIDVFSIGVTPMYPRSKFRLLARGADTGLHANLAGASVYQLERTVTLQILTSSKSSALDPDGVLNDQGCWQAEVIGNAVPLSTDGSSSFAGRTP